MTEADWLSCSDPQAMLTFLRGTNPVSDRKCRLLACACFYRLSKLLTHSLACAAVNIAERFTDGAASAEEFRTTHSEVSEAFDGFIHQQRVAAGLESNAALPISAALGMSIQVTSPNAALAASNSCVIASWTIAAYSQPGKDTIDPEFSRAERTEKTAQAELLRDLVGPFPFRPLSLAPAWLTSTVLMLAQGIYDEKAFDRMPILADCLMDQGCDNEDILNHCRDEGQVHVRGCWVVDAVLGRS